MHVYIPILLGAKGMLAVELQTVAADWRSLMLRLGLEQWQLRIISRDHPTVREQLESALDLWLRNKRDASWADVVCALEGMEEKVLASRIRTKYCQSDPGIYI